MKKKKGFTVIELFISLLFISIVLSFVGLMSVKASKCFYSDSKKIKNEFYIQETFRYIDSLVYDSKSMTIKNNSIEIYKLYDKTNNNLIDWKAKATIFQSGNNLMVSHEATNISKTNNVLVRNIESFKVEAFGKLVNITIKSTDDEEFEKCIEIH